ncbi:MAG: Nif3-like dinuclear metal center hexameric protein [Lentisphaerae bacterium GWF2_44_16]|nr:MAG: Nif3-like dinuclear metal center hexameric protein [Lentisphaerae bacterium GWF2_44_16]
MKKQLALKKLTSYLDNLLQIEKIPADHSNNGLQVEGNPYVSKAVFGVDACMELFEKAKKKKADFIMVHHGLSWENSFKRLNGLTGDRVRILFQNGISLYAVHLPLDAHPKYGNNAVLSDIIGLKDREMFFEYSNVKIGIMGKIPKPMTATQVGKLYDARLNSKHVMYGDPERKVSRIGIVSGGAASAVNEAANLGLDCFVTGEVGHSSSHVIKESGIPVISLGHYCSETTGVAAVMKLLQNKFKIDCEFIDIPTGL